MSNKRVIFFCFKCEKQGFCDRDIIIKKREGLLMEWRNSNLFVKAFSSKLIDYLFDEEEMLLDRCKADLKMRNKV